jgi:CheY-like chemotaxis protein
MLRHGLILTSQREYAQAMRTALQGLGDGETRVDVELDALRAMQLVPQVYDLILVDAALDAMDGVQLLLLMKQQAPAATFLIVSDFSDEVSRAQAYQNGADFFLERPRTPEAIQVAVDAIRGLLQRHLESGPSRDDSDGHLLRIADIVQTRCLSGDSVLLTVRSEHRSGDIFIYRGEVFHAQYPGMGGESAFFDIMRWDGGRLRVDEHKLAHVPLRTIETPYGQLLTAVEKSSGLSDPAALQEMGELPGVAGDISPAASVASVAQEAPPLKREEVAAVSPAVPHQPEVPVGETPLPPVNSHWKINLMGELVEGSQVSETGRCAFITYFIYRKLADVAVVLEVDYFNELTLFGPHLQQVLVADNFGVRHAVFDAAWRTETDRMQYVKWCREQSI